MSARTVTRLPSFPSLPLLLLVTPHRTPVPSSAHPAARAIRVRRSPR
ncbi:hypothetical protein SUDANB176_03165 [Streptomyces sp. enrichment culture]